MEQVEFARRMIGGLAEKVIGVLWSGGKASSVLWHMTYSEMDNAVPIFIDHGKHPAETHELLHQMYRAGNFRPEIWRNDDRLAGIRDGKIEGRPYDMHDVMVKKWLYDEVLAEEMDYDIILSGERIARREENRYLRFLEFFAWKDGGQTIIIRPLLTWSEMDIWAYLLENKVPFNQRYSKGWRIVDYDDDWKPCDKPAWTVGNEYDETAEKLNIMAGDINALPR